jgi:hypothetical protein
MKETREETYRKIYIKSEADLPKERTILIAHFKHSDRWTDLIYFNTSEDDKYWISEVDYYLNPIEQENLTAVEKEEINEGYRSLDPLFEGLEQEKPQTAEEYIKDIWGELWLEIDWHAEDVIEALTEFASQKHIPTDEEIEKNFPTNIYKLAESLHIPQDLMSAEMSEALRGIQEGNENKQIGAKWLKDKIK